MDSISGRQPKRLLHRTPIGSGRRGSQRISKLFKIAANACLGMLLLTLAPADIASQEGEGERGVAPAPQVSSAVEFGAYHALIIGINDYSLWPRLKFAEQDASDIRQILINRYGFASERVTFLSGAKATRSKILGGLRQKLESLGKNDNLLVYYAGHGQLDPLTETGYWIPAEGGLYDEFGWISFSNIKTLLTGPGVKAKSVIVMTDSCYGGALARSGPTPGHRGPTGDDYQQYQQKLAKLAQKRSRQIIASGGYEQVPDRSDFASLLKQALKENTYPMVDLEYLFFGQIYPKLKFIGQQEPAFARLVSGPDSDGQFVLLQPESTAQTSSILVTQTEPTGEETSSTSVTPTEPAATDPQPVAKTVLTVRSNVYNDTVYINGQARGSTRLDVELEPGLHSVIVEKEGYRPFEEQVELKPGEAVVLWAKLEPIEPPAAAAPVIHFFIADPPEIARGQPTVLRWETQDAEHVEIAGFGRVELSGSWPIEPGQSANYVLIAQNRQGRTVQREVWVNVVAEAPRIVSFNVDPSQIRQGEAATLSWQTENARSVHIDWFGRVELSGAMQIRPASSVTYTLIAENEQGKAAEKVVTIAVSARSPQVLSFETERQTIQKGESAILRWQVLDATEVNIDGDRVQPSGSLRVRPQQDHRYILIASNAEGVMTTRELTIRVVVPAPEIVSFRATSPITAGGTATLKWRTNNAVRAQIPGLGGVSLSGTKRVRPTATTTYTLVATNEEGEQTQESVSVKVNPKKLQPGLVVVPSTVMKLAKFMPAPVQIAPAHGSVYHHYPRKTKLSWKPVAGAKHYTVEIEFKSGDKWHPYKKQSGLKTGYTFNFVGAQPGRWRVWAVNSAGKDGLASKWREFRYTK